MKQPAVFLDRDGTLIEERHYLHQPEEVRLFSGVPEALARLCKAGFLLVLVTNQSGVGRGYFTLDDVARVHSRLKQDLGPEALLSAIYIAPEAPGEPSRGRKPSPQFLFDARDSLGVDLARSYMLGDKLIDLECGWNAGVKQCLLVSTGYGQEQAKLLSPEQSARTVLVKDLPAAADWILEDAGRAG